jgi:fumarate reductase subunit C
VSAAHEVRVGAAPPHARLETWMWIAQRASALVLALAVVVHLATIITAVQGGLSAAEIVDRLRGHAGWLSFYLVFVLAAAVHAPLGMRNVLREWTPLGPRTVMVATGVLGAALLILGARAAFALFHAPL